MNRIPCQRKDSFLYSPAPTMVIMAYLVFPLSSSPESSVWDSIMLPIYQNLGHLILTAVAIFLAYLALKRDRALRENQLTFEKHKFESEESERKKLAKFRELEFKRFSEPSDELAKHLAEKLISDPHWAYRALEAAKLLPYTDTLFDERTQHFRKEKQELALRFTPYLFKRCEHYIKNLNKEVWLLIDAGTTLLPFFEIIGKETVKLSQKNEEWINHLHLATNNLRGIEQIIKYGRRIPEDRYTTLAIEDCILLPGIPLPIFAAVAGNLTNRTIMELCKNPTAFTKNNHKLGDPVFIALVVGNWIRIRHTSPRCPIPMVRGVEHLNVKQTMISNADEIFVISPLGKIFVDASNEKVNNALGFKKGATDTDKMPYGEVQTEYSNKDSKKTFSKANIMKLVTTTRIEGKLLYRHSNRVEDALGSSTNKYPQYSKDEFAETSIEKIASLIFPFNDLPDKHYEEFIVEFPHYHTRTSEELINMFSVSEP